MIRFVLGRGLFLLLSPPPLFFFTFHSIFLLNHNLPNLQMEFLKFISKLVTWFHREFYICLVNIQFSKIQTTNLENSKILNMIIIIIIIIIITKRKPHRLLSGTKIGGQSSPKPKSEWFIDKYPDKQHHGVKRFSICRSKTSLWKNRGPPENHKQKVKTRVRTQT